MKKLCFVLAVCSALFLFGCKKNTDLVTFKEFGLALPISSETLEAGVDFEETWPLLVITWSDRATFYDVQNEFYQLSPEELTVGVYDSFQKRFNACYQTIVGILVLDEEDYADDADSPVDVSSFTEFGRNDGIVYLYYVKENDTVGMTEENEKRFAECRKAVLSAINKAQFIPLEFDDVIE